MDGARQYGYWVGYRCAEPFGEYDTKRYRVGLNHDIALPVTRLHNTWGDEDLAERSELEWRSRTDPMAKDFVSRQCPVSPTNINGDALCDDINAVMLG